VLGGDVVDELGDQHRLAHAGAAEEADLGAFAEGDQQVDHLDAGLEDVDVGGLVSHGWCGTMDRESLAFLGGVLAVYGVADNIEHPAQGRFPDRNRDRGAGVDDLGPAHQSFGRLHRDRPRHVVAKVVFDLEDQPLGGALNLQRRHDLGQVVRVELDVDDRPDDLGDATFVAANRLLGCLCVLYFRCHNLLLRCSSISLPGTAPQRRRRSPSAPA
jgi:hypothetical protein